MDPVSTNKTLIEQGMELYDFHYQPWNIVLMFHIITASLAIVIGPFQFFKKIRINRKSLHRNLGKIYVITILVSGVTGFIYLFMHLEGIFQR
jgi:uncharacterized membrane protein